MATLLDSYGKTKPGEEVYNPLNSNVTGSSAVFVERMVILGDAAESLLCKLYELYTMQDFLSSGFPKLGDLLVRKFPTHPKDINLTKFNAKSMEHMLSDVEGMIQNLEPWYYCLVDVMEYYKAVLSVLSEADTLLRSADASCVEGLLKSFAQTATGAIRVQVLLASTPKQLIVQLYALAYFLDYRSNPNSGLDSHEKPTAHDDLLLFLTRFDSVIPCLQQDFGEYQLLIEKSIKNIFGPYCTLACSIETITKEKILTEVRPRYDIGPIVDATHRSICEQLAKVDEYRDSMLWLSIACPMILTDTEVIDFLRIVLDETLLLQVFRDINLWIHAELLVHAYPKMKQILKSRKQPRQAHKTNLRSMVVNCFSVACAEAPEKHIMRREFVLSTLNHTCASLLYNPNISFAEVQQCLVVLAFAKSEVLWHMHHWKESIPQGLPTVLKLPYEEPLVKNCTPIHILKIIKMMKVLIDGLLAREKEISCRVVAHMEEKVSKIYHALKNLEEVEFSVTVKSIKSILLLGFPQAGGSGNLTAMRISWLRYLALYPTVKIQALDKLSIEKYNFPLLAEILDLVNGSYSMDKLQRQVTKMGDMKLIYYFIDKFNSIVENSLLRDLDIDENLPGILEIHRGFLKNNHARCQVIVDDDVVKPVGDLLEKISETITRTVLQIEEEGYGTTEGASDIVRASKPSAEKRKGKSNKRKSIFDFLDSKLTSPSLLGKYKMLLGLIKVLSDGKDFELSKYIVKPQAFLYAALKSAFESFFVKTVGLNEPYPEPSALLPKISKFVNLLQSFQSATSLNIGRLVRDVIYQETPSRTKFRMPIAPLKSDSVSITISERYAMWYVSSIIHDKDIVYSPKLRAFSNGNFSWGSESSHLNANELKAFLRVFGLYGTLAFWNEIEKSIVDSLTTIFRELTNNQTLIAEVIFATSKRETKSYADLERKSFILEPAINASRILGRCIHLLDLLCHSAQLAFGESFSGLQESLVNGLETNATEVLDKIEFQQAHLLAYALGRKTEGVNPVLSSLFETMSISTKSFDLVEQLFASFLSHTSWKNTSYYAESESLDQDMLSISLAFRHLCYLVGKCTPGVASEADRQSVTNKFESFLETAAPLVFDQEVSAGPKVLFIEYMLDDLYFSQSILEKHIPTILIKSIRN